MKFWLSETVLAHWRSLAMLAEAILPGHVALFDLAKLCYFEENCLFTPPTVPVCMLHPCRAYVQVFLPPINTPTLII